MLNAMQELEVEVPCPVCSESYTVSVETIRESQRLIAEGCPGTSTCDCAAHYYATLLPPEAAAQLSMKSPNVA
jgi:hypothetical protein